MAGEKPAEIEERKHKEGQLRASEGKFGFIMKHAPVGMALFDLEGRWTDIRPGRNPGHGFLFSVLAPIAWANFSLTFFRLASPSRKDTISPSTKK